METPHHSAVRYRPDIDGLRATAVVAVVIYHGFPRLFPGGFVGVDVFFVISGYLITQLIARDLDEGRFSLAEFYARRVRRLFPALIAVLFATVAVGIWIFLPSELTSLAKNALASAFFSANLMLLSEAGYFDIAARLKPLLHLWSLGIEEQFYLAWPIALWLTSPRWRTVIILVTMLASFALNVALVETHPQATFYLPFTRVWELLAGAALVGISIKSSMLRTMLSAVGCATCITIGVYHPQMTFPGWAAVVPVVGAAATILAEGSFLNRTVLSHPITTYIGKISYPLYLWHWPLLVFANAYAFRKLSPIEVSLLIAASFALAALTYEVIEKPIRFGKRAGIKVALVGMSATAMFAAVAVNLQPPLPGLIERYVAVDTGSTEWRLHNCMLVDGDPTFAPSCVDPERPLIVLWGDSAAGALMPGFRELQSGYEFGIGQFTVSGCKPLLVHAPYIEHSCVDRNLEVMRRLTEVRPRTVVLNALWATTSDELRPTIEALRSIEVDRIIILGIVPVWRGGLPNAVATYYRRTGDLIPERTTLFVDPQVGAADSTKSVADDLGVEFISLRNALCDKDGCITRLGPDLIVSDWLHFTPAGSKYLMTKIGPAILGPQTKKKPATRLGAAGSQSGR